MRRTTQTLVGVVGGSALIIGLGAPAQAAAKARSGETRGTGVSDISDITADVAEVTESDANLASAVREVVVVAEGPDGPQVRKFRAATKAQAGDLAEDLNAMPGVVADANKSISVPDVPSEPTLRAKDAGTVAIDGAAGPAFRASGAVSPLGGEAYGSYQWGLSAVNAEAAWAVTRGSGVTVAVIDSGVDATHPDLGGRVLPQVDLVDDPWTGDPDGHGTHVAGIVAASLDGAGVAGLANQVSVLPVRVLDANGTGDSYTIASGIYAAVDAGAEVINLSLGGSYNSSVVAQAVAYADDRGVSVVAAAGNEYEEGNPVTYPAALPGVIGVSSINPDGQSSWFANSGSYVDVSAPGETILSTVPGGGWDYMDGTSAATPFVAATAALARVANPTLTKAGIDDVLLSTALDDAEGDGRDNCFGAGLLQADRATTKAAQAPGGVRAEPAPAPAPAPTPAPAAAPAAAVKVKAVSGQSKLRVDVNPNKGKGHWTFQVQRKQADGSWKPLRTYRTTGSKETRTINLPKGSYRVLVNSKYGYQGTTSTSVYLKK